MVKLPSIVIVITNSIFFQFTNYLTCYLFVYISVRCLLNGVYSTYGVDR